MAPQYHNHDKFQIPNIKLQINENKSEINKIPNRVFEF